MPTYPDRKTHRAALLRATALHPPPVSSRALQRWISPMTICHFDEGDDTDDNAKRDRCGGVEAGRYDEESSYLQYGKSQTYLCKRKKAFRGNYDTRSYSLIHTGLRTDDRLVNLTLLSKQEAGNMSASRSRRRGIYKVNPGNRNVLAFYKSSREAAAKEYCSYQTILDSCNGKTRRNATGYSFVWSEVVDDSSGWI